MVTGQRPAPTLEAVQADPRLIQVVVNVAHSFAWTQGYVTAAGWLDWLAQLPLEQRLTLPDGMRLLGVHATPGNDDGHGLHPALSDAELSARLAGCEADLVCVGHTHWPMDRRVDSVRVVNLGSVSNPMAPDLRASYILLDAGASGYWLQYRHVEYDHQTVIEAVEQSRHPDGDFIIGHQLGQRQPAWKEAI